MALYPKVILTPEDALILVRNFDTVQTAGRMLAGDDRDARIMLDIACQRRARALADRIVDGDAPNSEHDRAVRRREQGYAE